MKTNKSNNKAAHCSFMLNYLKTCLLLYFCLFVLVKYLNWSIDVALVNKLSFPAKLIIMQGLFILLEQLCVIIILKKSCHCTQMVW